MHVWRLVRQQPAEPLDEAVRSQDLTEVLQLVLVRCERLDLREHRDSGGELVRVGRRAHRLEAKLERMHEARGLRAGGCGAAANAAAAAANAAANDGYSLSAAHKDCGSSPHRGSSTEGKGAYYASPHKGPHSSRLGGGHGAEGSVHSDCGDCKNCLDKRKFGGRGIRKQACVRRSCYNAQEASDDESPSSP